MAVKLSLPTVTHDGSHWAARVLFGSYIGFVVFGNIVHRMAAHMYGLYTR